MPFVSLLLKILYTLASVLIDPHAVSNNGTALTNKIPRHRASPLLAVDRVDGIQKITIKMFA